MLWVNCIISVFSCKTSFFGSSVGIATTIPVHENSRLVQIFFFFPLKASGLHIWCLNEGCDFALNAAAHQRSAVSLRSPQLNECAASEQVSATHAEQPNGDFSSAACPISSLPPLPFCWVCIHLKKKKKKKVDVSHLKTSLCQVIVSPSDLCPNGEFYLYAW